MNKSLIAVLIVGLAVGFAGGFWTGKSVSQPALSGPGALIAVPLATETANVNGTITSVDSGKVTLSSGWVIKLSGGKIKYPSGQDAELKTGIMVSGTLKSPQKPGEVDLSAFSSITATPVPAASALPQGGSSNPGVTIANGTVTKVSGSTATLDSGWTVDLDGATLKFPSGMTASQSDIKVGANLSVSLNNPQMPGSVKASNVKSVVIAPVIK